jgi:hypothetical protein
VLLSHVVYQPTQKKSVERSITSTSARGYDEDEGKNGLKGKVIRYRGITYLNRGPAPEIEKKEKKVRTGTHREYDDMENSRC